LVNPPLDELAAMTPDDFHRRFRGSAIRRTKYSGLRRNVAVAMGNSGDPAFVPQLEKLAADPDLVVAEHARWALARLRLSS
jgi:epoxyqueuosine reductase